MTTKTANNKLTEARLQKTWSKAKLAKEADVSYTTIFKAEKGDDVRDYNQTKIARALGLKREDIFLNLM